MIVQSFRSVLWVGAVAGAAISCYMVSLRVAAERAALERVETNILIAKRDIRSLDTELTTRGRLRQLERWNSDVLALTAPTEGQFLEGEVQLASLGRVDPPALGTDGGTGEEGEEGERFMHAVAAPPPATQARTILADYKPARSGARPDASSDARPDVRLVKASVIKAAPEKRAKDDASGEQKPERTAKPSIRPKTAKRDADTSADHKPAAKTTGRETAAVSNMAGVSNKAGVVNKKAKAKTTT